MSTKDVTSLNLQALYRSHHKVHVKTLVLLEEATSPLGKALHYALDEFLKGQPLHQHWKLGLGMHVEGHRHEGVFYSKVRWLVSHAKFDMLEFARISIDTYEGVPLSVNHFVKPHEVPVAGSSLWSEDADYILLIPVCAAMMELGGLGFKVHDYRTPDREDPDPILKMTLVRGHEIARLTMDFRVLEDDWKFVDRLDASIPIPEEKTK